MLGTLPNNGMYTRTEGAPASGVYARFYIEAVEDPVGSAREGRPIFRDETHVEIIMPGNQNTVAVHRVTDIDVARFPEAWAAFKHGEEQSRTGTPLEQWCAVGRAQVKELKALDIYTVEDVANLPDTAAQRVMGLFGLRNRAKAWLDDAAQTAIVGELQAQNDKLSMEIASERRQREELSQMVQQLHGEVMAMRNAPHPFQTAMIPEAMRQNEYRVVQESAGSSLSAFEHEEVRRRPGRPRKVPEDTLVG